MVCFISILIVKVDKYLLECEGLRVRHYKIDLDLIVSVVLIALMYDHISIAIRDVYSELTS